MSEELTYFKASFEESRQSFLELAKTIGGELRSYKIPSKKDSDLSFETLYLPPTSGDRERLLILTSGIHGIEGLTGSALQRFFLANDFLKLKDDKLGVLIIHGINPFGFKHKRRVTENNVDLNRNFDLASDLFQTKNQGYSKVYNFLNPKTRFTRFLFHVTAVSNIFKYGVSTLRNAILRGQYQYPEGLFFGGKTFEPQVPLLRQEIERVASDFEKVLLIDIHTGYGERNKLHLFGNKSPFIEQAYMESVFKGMSVDYGDEKDFYSVTGSFLVFLGKLFHEKKKYAGICFEFGTINSQKLSGSLDSLHRMINENQKEASAADKTSFEEMFYPSCATWRQAVLKQFEESLKTVLMNFSVKKSS